MVSVPQIHILLLCGEEQHANLINPQSGVGHYYFARKTHSFHEGVRALEEAAAWLIVNIRHIDVEDIEEYEIWKFAENIKGYRNTKLPPNDEMKELEWLGKTRLETAIKRYGDHVPLDRFPFAPRWQALLASGHRVK